MSRAQATWRRTGYILMAVGSILLIMAILQDYAGMSFFSEPPYLVAIGVGAIGVVLAAGTRASRRAETANASEHGPAA